MNQDAQPRDLLLMMGMIVVAAVGKTSEAGRVSVDWFEPFMASVDLRNALNDTVVLHCWSRESDFGSTPVPSGKNYFWDFHPNIFGRTVYKCSFLWKAFKQEFAVWKGSYHDDQPKCCENGPCSYKICPDGIYTADTDDESWVLVAPWYKNS